MINKEKLRQNIEEYPLVVWHSFNDDQHQLLYVGDDKISASMMLYGYSDNTSVSIKGKIFKRNEVSI